MAKVKKKENSNSVLAEQIDEWARKNGVARNSYVSELSNSLRENSDLHKWAEMDPFEHLPLPEPRSSNNTVRRIDLLSNIRNVLVFAPVGLTWAAVGQATQGFQKYVSQNGATVVNFLEFWQNGYGVLSSFWRISDIARLDFIIIAAVIALTIATSVLSRRVGKQEEIEMARIESDRSSLATKITLHLFDKKKITNITFNQSMAGAIQKLTNATTALEKTARELQKISKKFPKAD